MVSEALRAVHPHVIAHDDLFPQDTDDEVWLRAAGEHEWVVLMRDDRIRYRPGEQAAVLDAGVTNDRHVRIGADGHEDELDAIDEFYGFDSKVAGSEDAAREKYLRHNRMVAEQLLEAGLYPDGDVNAYLRTGGDVNDSEDGSAGG